ncbi:MAG: hypothetical protein KatS3mg110_0923 [Pirellulaceae bacterium]|nr:MAG: hypothetical protein KatS3mg110_0923 [Pirellulaceae bacterium]
MQRWDKDEGACPQWGNDHVGNAPASNRDRRKASVVPVRRYGRAKFELLLSVMKGGSVEDACTAVCRVFEKRFPGSHCSLHRIHGNQLEFVAGPSLDPSYCEKIRRVPIGPNVGSCGTAAFTGKIVITEDIATDPRWQPYRHLVEPYGLRSCWSIPVRGPDGVPIATFAVYYKQPSRPTRREVRFLKQWGDLVGLALYRENQRRRLDEAQRSFRTLIDSAPEGIVLLDVEAGKFVRVNPAAEKLFGAPAERLLEVGPFELSPERQPDGELSRVAGHRWIEKALRGEQPVFEWVHTSADGREFTAEVRLLRLEWEGRTVIRGCIIDITERKQLEKQLSNELAFVSAIMDGVPCTVFLFDPEQRMLRWNKLVEETSEYSAEEVARMRALEFIAPEDHPRVIAAIHDVFVKGSGYVEATLVTKSGKRIPYLYRGVRVTTADGVRLLGMGVDLTERKQLEAQLLHNEKMSCVGRLAAGIAHDFNNLLTVILGYSELLEGNRDLQAVQSGRDVLHQLRAIRESAERARELTSQLLAFSRQSLMQTRPIDLNEFLKNSRPLLEKLLKTNIQFHCHYTDRPVVAVVDPNQILQVVMNLCANAVDAMPNGGELTVAIESVDLPEGISAGRLVLRPGSYAVIKVQDTGCGIPLDVQNRVFDPFFTTKEVGKGTGLGLAVAHGIVQQHSGGIDFESTCGAGTTFRIYLPEKREEKPAEISIADSTKKPLILVVDDEQVVRKFVAMALETHGFRVTTASSAPEALRLIDSGETPELIITDLVMPGMNGREFAEQLQQRRPECRFLFVSGYTADAAFRQGLLEQKVAFLAKPFSPSALVEKIRSMLGQGTVESNN